ncbi:hypothetical protein AGMMS50276_04100 [Synergistales bacterium]|nr:hypothetical protein AGMMS50276_04100 [Synergistales bacterium]
MGFSSGVSQNIGSYVYRLIDPRDGSTFYVGKGKGDRVFAHVKDAFRPGDGLIDEENEDDVSLKLATIRAIIAAGLDVIHIIHRHGMDNDTAFEVEAALIDVYQGLANEIGGHGSADRGPMNVQQIDNLYKAKEINPDFDGYHCVIVKIRQATINNNDGNVYQAARRAWRIVRSKWDKLEPELKDGHDHYVLAVVNGIVRAVYKNPTWSVYSLDPKGNPYRYEFTDTAPVITGKDQPANVQWLDNRIPSDFTRQGLADPFLLGW